MLPKAKGSPILQKSEFRCPLQGVSGLGAVAGFIVQIHFQRGPLAQGIINGSPKGALGQVSWHYHHGHWRFVFDDASFSTAIHDFL